MKELIANLRMCLALLDRRTRLKWLLLIPCTVVVGFIETLGAAVIFALVRILNDPAQASQMPFVDRVPWLLSESGTAVVVTFALAVAAFHLVKNVFLAALINFEGGIVSASLSTLSARVLKAYLSAPYSFHLRRNSSTIIHHTGAAIEVTLKLALTGTILLISEVFVVGGIIGALVIVAPLATLASALVLGVVLAVLLKATRGTAMRLGVEESGYREAIIKTLRQSLGALKEVRVAGRERFFFDEYTKNQRGIARIQKRYMLMTALPRLFVEMAFVCATITVIVFVAVQGTAHRDILPVLGLFAYAGFRAIPSANRIIMSVNNIRFGSSYLRELTANISELERGPSYDFDAPAPDVAFERALCFEDVAFAYAGGVFSLQDISLVVRPGESIGIVGQTGSGKSTLVHILLGLLDPTAGRVTVDGVDVFENLRGWRRRIGYVPQDPPLFDDTIRRNVAFGLPDAEIDEGRLAQAIRMAHLEAFVAGLPEGHDTVVGERGVRLSGGERQRVAIARALYHEPTLIVFDEATSALDNQTERAITGAIETLRGNKTLVVIAHRLSTVQRCDRIVLLRNGRIEGSGTYDELLEDHPGFRALVLANDLDETRR